MKLLISRHVIYTKQLTLTTIFFGISSAIELLQELMKHFESEYSFFSF